MCQNKLNIFYQKQKEIYDIYNNDIRDAIIFIESSYHVFPVPFLNEIRAAQDHLARCIDYPLDDKNWEEYICDQIQKAKGHYNRCLLDCYKYIWYRYGQRLYWSHLIPKCLGKLHDIDNGNFYKKYKQLHNEAKNKNHEARKLERTDKERAKDLFKDAIGCLKQMDDLFEENYDKISWSVAKGFAWRLIWATGWIISAIYFFVRNSDPIAMLLGILPSFRN